MVQCEMTKSSLRQRHCDARLLEESFRDVTAGILLWGKRKRKYRYIKLFQINNNMF